MVVSLVADALLKGHGVGAAFKRVGEPFQLRDGVKIIPLKRTGTVDAADYKAMREEFYKSKGTAEQEYRERFPSPP